MKVLLTGGGTGGHITPILAVAHELKSLNPATEVVYVGERHGKFTQLTEGNSSIDAIYNIYAGKLRRYHGQSWLARIVDIKTNLLNVRDGIYLVLGLVQAWLLLGKVKPDVVFLKGGFVGVPIGLAAAMRHIDIITHDSDALPGLANRLVSRWARVHATALPARYYKYPEHKVRPVGVLVEHTYKMITSAVQAQYKRKLNIPNDSRVLLITGASSGAARLNEVVVGFVEGLLGRYPDLYVIHQVGKGKSGIYDSLQHPRLDVQEFLQPMYLYMGAADVVVGRASGNTVAELGVQSKAAIVIPNPDLTGGHQLKNAQRLEELAAAIVIYEDKLYDKQHGLMAAVEKLLINPNARVKLGSTLHTNTLQGAAHTTAQLLLHDQLDGDNKKIHEFKT